MPLGNNYNSGNNNKQNMRPTVYSGYKMTNLNSDIDKTNLTFTFWNGMIKISIAPLKEGSNSENIAFDYDNTDPVYLTHTKARMLYMDACDFQNSNGTFNSQGVPTGKGLIYFSNGSEFGKAGIFLVIKKVNAENGEVESSFTYEINSDLHFSIRNFDESTGSFDKVMRPDLELEQFKTMLKTFYEAMTGAMAYSFMDYNRFDNSKIQTKLGLIMDKLGIESKGGSKSSGGGSSYFSGNKGGGKTSTGMNNGSQKMEDADKMFDNI